MYIQDDACNVYMVMVMLCKMLYVNNFMACVYKMMYVMFKMYIWLCYVYLMYTGKMHC